MQKIFALFTIILATSCGGSKTEIQTTELDHVIFYDRSIDMWSSCSGGEAPTCVVVSEMSGYHHLFYFDAETQTIVPFSGRYFDNWRKRNDLP